MLISVKVIGVEIKLFLIFPVTGHKEIILPSFLVEQLGEIYKRCTELYVGIAGKTAARIADSSNPCSSTTDSSAC